MLIVSVQDELLLYKNIFFIIIGLLYKERIVKMSHTRDNDLTPTQLLSNYWIQYQRRKPHYVHDIFTQFASIQYAFSFQKLLEDWRLQKNLVGNSEEQFYQGAHVFVM